MAKYCVFESTNMRAVHFAKRIFDCVFDEDIENGTLGYLGELVESNVYKFVKGYKEGAQVVVVNQPAWTEDECRRANQRRDKFVVPANVRFRAFAVDMDDEFGISIEGVTPATREVVENVTDFMTNDVYLTIDADSGKLVASTSSTEGAVMEARIERKRMVGGLFVTEAHKYGYRQDIYEARIKVLA